MADTASFKSCWALSVVVVAGVVGMAVAGVWLDHGGVLDTASFKSCWAPSVVVATWAVWVAVASCVVSGQIMAVCRTWPVLNLAGHGQW